MRQGIWQCSEGCRQWWYWRVLDSTNLFDRRCPKCQRRSRTLLDRKPGGRGKPRQFVFMERPSYEPRYAIREELQNRNAQVNKRRAHEETYRQLNLGTFVKASSLTTSEHNHQLANCTCPLCVLDGPEVIE
jgi:hypothetical protein